MLLNQNNLLLSEYCSKESSKPEITGIYITPEATVATNTYMLVEVSTPQNVKSDDFPKHPTQLSRPKQIKTIIPADLAKSVAKKIKPNNLPILETAAIVNFKNEEQITFASTNLELWEETTGKVIKGQYPNYKQIIPQGQPKAKININLEYLQKSLTALARTTDNLKTLEILIYDNSKPVVLKTNNDIQKTTVLIMPIATE